MTLNTPTAVVKWGGKNQNDITQARMKNEEIAADTDRQKQTLTALYQRTNYRYKLTLNEGLAVEDIDKLAAMAQEAAIN